MLHRITLRRVALPATASLLVLAVLANGLGSGGEARAAAPGISLERLGTYASEVPFDGDFGAAEIPAYDPITRRVFVVNAQQERIDVLDISSPSNPSEVGAIQLESTPNSVAVSDGQLAVAVEADPKTAPGTAALYATSCDPGTCEPLNEIEVGALPDMLTFSPSGRYLLVANEGEPLTAEDDPMGTISVIDLRKGAERPIVETVDFSSLDGTPPTVPTGAVLAPGRQPRRDFEPEYITVSTDSRTAWVALQEANAIAEIDVSRARLAAVRGLGFKDHGLERNSLDVSDRDNSINMCTWSGVHGIYMPDGIASYQVRNRYYVVTANEGDSRDENNPFTDESRVNALPSSAFIGSPFSAELRDNRNLGRLTVNKNLGLVNGVYQGLYVYGARSFAIWSDSGDLVYDSGNDFERIVDSFPAPITAYDPYASPLLLEGPTVPTAKSYKCPIPTSEALPTSLPPTTPANSNHEEGPSFDNRSDNKGPEPEGVTLGRINGHTYAFLSLERASGIMVYDVTDPAAAKFVEYLNPRNFAAEYALPDDPGEWETAGDLGSEGLVFVAEGESPTGAPLLIVANEVSGTTTIYEVGTA